MGMAIRLTAPSSCFSHQFSRHLSSSKLWSFRERWVCTKAKDCGKTSNYENDATGCIHRPLKSLDEHRFPSAPHLVPIPIGLTDGLPGSCAISTRRRFCEDPFCRHSKPASNLANHTTAVVASMPSCSPSSCFAQRHFGLLCRGFATVAEEVEQDCGYGSPPLPIPDFNDTETSYAGFSTLELVRAYIVLRLCAVRRLVENSEALLRFGYATVGRGVIDAFLQRTFFAHFCAGQTEEEVGQCSMALEKLGVGGILIYSAEGDTLHIDNDHDGCHEAVGATASAAAGVGHGTTPGTRVRVEEEDTNSYHARGYSNGDKCSTGEALGDVRTETFLSCIRTARNQNPPRGFVAVKFTALGNLDLIGRLTVSIKGVQELFKSLGEGNMAGIMAREEFEASYRRLFQAETAEDLDSLELAMLKLYLKGINSASFAEWSSSMRPVDITELMQMSHSKETLPGLGQGLSDKKLTEAMQSRIELLCLEASTAGVRLMIDAEQTWFQPAIDNTVYGLQRDFNRGEFPTVYTTVQCYLKDSLDRLAADLDRASRGGYIWAGKLVRGAYMHSERLRAMEGGYESPIFEKIEETHANYNAAIDMVLQHIAEGQRADVMIATHNQASIEHAIYRMRDLGVSTSAGVSFGQLLGMADNITFPLGANGFKAYKCVPYGRVSETLPYLIRRAQENSGVLAGAGHERRLLAKEIHRRLCVALM